MVKITQMSDEKLNEVSQLIGESFFDYPYEDGEGGLKELIGTRESMNEYMKALVKGGIACGSFYATSEKGEGYIMLTDSFGTHPGIGALLRMMLDIKNALGGWKNMRTFFGKVRESGETLETKMKKEKKPYVKVEMLLVTKPYQGQGYMRKLMKFAYKQADKKHAAVILDTDAKGKCERYEHLGMKLYGTRKTAGFTLYDLIREAADS